MVRARASFDLSSEELVSSVRVVIVPPARQTREDPPRNVTVAQVSASSAIVACAPLFRFSVAGAAWRTNVPPKTVRVEDAVHVTPSPI
mgnify:CR=1 FL=1